MPRRPRSRLLGCEAFESKVLLGGLSDLTPFGLVSNLIKSESDQHRVALNGSIDGTYSAPVSPPDAGKTYQLNGFGRVRPLGEVQALGALASTGFVASGRAGGTLTLANSRGSLTLRLVGLPQKGFSSLPDQFRFAIVRATGRYGDVHGVGTVKLTLGAEHASGRGHHEVGAPNGFTLRFHSA